MSTYVSSWFQEVPKARLAGLVGLLRYPKILATVVRNLIEAWPEAVYTDALVDGRVLGRKTLFVCAPSMIQTLLVDHADALAREDYVLRALAPALGIGVLTSDGESWKRQRRTAAPIFRHDQIAGFVPAMTKVAEDTRLRWLARESAKPLDMLDEMMRTTFDIIVATMLSNEPGLDVVAFDGHMAAYLRQTTWKMALTMIGAPAFTPHPGFLRGMLATRGMRKALATTIANRRASGQSGDDLLGCLLRSKDPENGAAMSDSSLIDNLLTFVAAGHETSALVMAWTFLLLAEHPQVEARVLDELATARSPDGSTDIAALVYSRQVLMEVMRLYPPAPLIARRTTRDISLAGRVIPANQSIQIPVYAVHRHRGHWSAPESFDPDRFAPSATSRERYAYLPFGGGARVCIGASFAMTECLVLLANLLPAIRFDMACRTRPETRFKVTLRPKGGVPLFVSPRHGDAQ